MPECLKRFSILLIFTLTSHLSFAVSTGNITALVVDSELDSMPIVGAIVELTKQGDNTGQLYYLTDGDGLLTITARNFGDYTITVSSMGYETQSIDFTLNTPELELENIRLKISAVSVDAVIKEIKALRTSQSGDSLQYQASAYKVAADADVEGLLQKMPGVTIEDGQVTAQGETITKIYIDGREFFGGDVATALKSLPAEVVDKIELFNKLSDEAEFSGVDDGSGAKTINIVTKPEMREGIFGKIFAGGGFEATPSEGASKYKYMGGGSVNIFKGKSRTSIVALVNNLNQQNFSFEDIMGATDEGSSTGEFTVKALPGIANVNAVGINYSNEFGEKVKLQGSYFYNQTETTNTENMTRWYLEPASATVDSLIQTVHVNTLNINNRLTGRLDIKFNDRHSLMIRPTLSYQVTEPTRETMGTRYDDTNTNYEDGMQYYASSKHSYWSGYNIGANFNYRYRLNDLGRMVSLNGGVSTNSYETDAETQTKSNYYPSSDIETLSSTYTADNTPTKRNNYSAAVTYNEPLTSALRLNVSYRLTSNYQMSDKRIFDTESDYLIEDFETTKTRTFAESTFSTSRVGAGLRYGIEGASFNANLYYQNSEFDVSTLRSKASTGLNSPYNDVKYYDNLTYSFVLKKSLNRSNSLRLYLNGDTSAPPIWRFVDNTTSTSSVYAGNSNLEPTYNNKFRLYFTRTSEEKGSTLMLNCNAQLSTNYVGVHTVLSPGLVLMDENDTGVDSEYDDVQLYTGYVNLDTYYKLDSNLTYGVPIDFLKCNLNFNGGVSYTSIPSVYGGTVLWMGNVEGGERVDSHNMVYRFGATLGSNISENVDFTLAWRGDYNDLTNIYSGIEYKNNYFNHTVSANMKLVLFGGLTIVGNANYKQYLGLTDSYNDRFVLLNAFVGHKMLKNNRGELLVGVNDLLDQNTSLVRTVANSYTQNTTNSTVGRYVSVQFIYNLRAFGIFGAKNREEL